MWVVQAYEQIAHFAINISHMPARPPVYVLVAAAFALGTTTMLLLPSNQDAQAATDVGTLLSLLNPLCLFGAGGFGVALVLIHIYLAPVKRTLQVSMVHTCQQVSCLKCEPLFMSPIC